MVVNVHMPNTCDNIDVYKDYVRKIVRALHPAAHCMSVILGEWNFRYMEDRRFLGDGTFGPGDRAQCDAFQDICGKWCELHQPGPTRRVIV